MPTYSYACTGCGHAFDIRQSFTDDSLTVCPECGETTLRKVIHPVGISFKGSGFYKTDSRRRRQGRRVGLGRSGRRGLVGLLRLLGCRCRAGAGKAGLRPTQAPSGFGVVRLGFVGSDSSGSSSKPAATEADDVVPARRRPHPPDRSGDVVPKQRRMPFAPAVSRPRLPA